MCVCMYSLMLFALLMDMNEVKYKLAHVFHLLVVLLFCYQYCSMYQNHRPYVRPTQWWESVETWTALQQMNDTSTTSNVQINKNKRITYQWQIIIRTHTFLETFHLGLRHQNSCVLFKKIFFWYFNFLSFNSVIYNWK